MSRSRDRSRSRRVSQRDYSRSHSRCFSRSQSRSPWARIRSRSVLISTPAKKRLMRDFKRLQQDPYASITGPLQDNNIMNGNVVIYGRYNTH